MLIHNKQIMYDLLTRGQFGNTLKIWNTQDEVLNDCCEIAGIRCKRPGYEFIYSIQSSLLEQTREQYCIRNKVDKNEVIFAENDFGFSRIISGEVSNDESGTIIHYSFGNGNMRELVRKGLYFEKFAHGLLANSILKTYLSYDQYDWIYYLQNEYESPIIEFSIFDKPLGMFYDNMVIWEVRHY